mmetsp:Transcript_22549/g.62913  ORF Transcript_22549/g.62913 Transcript_22549/m.62913 type:complete len:215 (+) Transcript_22549:462-1106(+)
MHPSERPWGPTSDSGPPTAAPPSSRHASSCTKRRWISCPSSCRKTCASLPASHTPTSWSTWSRTSGKTAVSSMTPSTICESAPTTTTSSPWDRPRPWPRPSNSCACTTSAPCPSSTPKPKRSSACTPAATSPSSRVPPMQRMPSPIWICSCKTYCSSNGPTSRHRTPCIPAPRPTPCRPSLSTLRSCASTDCTSSTSKIGWWVSCRRTTWWPTF